jgi:hypothetical protein
MFSVSQNATISTAVDVADGFNTSIDPITGTSPRSKAFGDYGAAECARKKPSCCDDDARVVSCDQVLAGGLSYGTSSFVLTSNTVPVLL